MVPRSACVPTPGRGLAHDALAVALCSGPLAEVEAETPDDG